MNKRKNIGKRLAIFTIALALIVAILFVFVFNLWISNKHTQASAKENEEIGKTDKQKYEQVFYNNGWDKNIISEMKEEVPIPTGFEYVSGTKDNGFIIKDSTTSQKMMWIPYDENAKIDNIDEYYAQVNYDTIDLKAYKNITKYGGFYVLISEQSEYNQLKNINQEIYNNARETAKKLYEKNEIVSSHLAYKTEIEQVLSFAKKIGINLEQTEYSSDSGIKIDKLIQSTIQNGSQVDNANMKLSLVVVDIETNSSLGEINGFSQENWYVYDVPVIIKTPKGKELTVPVPVGFDVEVDNNVVTITSQGEYNLSYVWIPVNEEFNTKDFSEEGIAQMTANLKQAYGIADRTQEEILDYVKDPVDSIEYRLLQESVKKYGGFYMGQAELGFDNETSFNNQVRGLNYIIDEETGKKETYAKNGDYYRSVSTQIVKENTEQNLANYTNSALEKNNDGGYTLTYEKAKDLTRQSNQATVSASSNLIYGAQWNAALLWIINSGNGYNIEQLVKNSEDLPGAKYESVEWETEITSLETINGLYGIAGNLSDLTQEIYSENNSSTNLSKISNINIQNEEYYISRGGNYGTTGQEKTASGYQIVNDQIIENDSLGIRDCLILHITSTDKDILSAGIDKQKRISSNNYNVEKVVSTVDVTAHGSYLYGNGKALLIADLIHSWLVRHDIKYDLTRSKYVPSDTVTDCSHYISMILYEYGYVAPFTDWNYAKKKRGSSAGNSAQFVTYDIADMVNYSTNNGSKSYGPTLYGMSGVQALNTNKWRSSLKPGDIYLMNNDDHIQMYAGNNRWYNAGANKYISETESNNYKAPYINSNILNSCTRGIRLVEYSNLNYNAMQSLFATYNSKAWEKNKTSINQIVRKSGHDSAVLWVIMNVAKSREIIYGTDYNYFDRYLESPN